MAHFPSNAQIYAYSIKAITIACLFLTISLHAQNHSVTNKKAIKHYEKAIQELQNGKETDALLLLQKAIKEEPLFVEAFLVQADVHYNNQNYQGAIPFYEQAVKINPTFHQGAWYYLATSYFKQENYENATTAYNNYIAQFKGKDSTRYAEAQHRIKQIAFIQASLSNPVSFSPKNLGSHINSQNAEYLPSLTADEQTLVITVRRPADAMTIGGNQEEEDFYIAFKQGDQTWSQTQPLPPPINSHGNEGAQCISPDGRFIYFTLCNAEGGFGSCDLYVSERQGNRWTTPKNLGKHVNSNAWDSQPSISSDGKTLYFVSNRKGGYGESDIWKTEKQANGEWSPPINMGERINTKGREMSPFIHPSNTRLFFASDGLIGMGGLDIFYTDYSQGAWTNPVNLGYPINTSRDEMSLIVSASGKEALFASDGMKGFGKSDIYSFDLYPQARPQPVTYVKGTVLDRKTKQPLTASFELVDLTTGKTVAASTSDRQTGNFLVCIPVQNSYYAFLAQAKGYLFYSEHFAMENLEEGKPFHKNINMAPIEVGERIVLNNVFFETGKYDLKSESRIELDKLVALLQANPTMKIEIGGHTDHIGDKASNLILSTQRAQSVCDYLISHAVTQAQLSMKGYGDSKPVASNDSEEGRAKNRRTEFVVLHR